MKIAFVAAVVVTMPAFSPAIAQNANIETTLPPPSGETLGLNCVTCHGPAAKGEGAIPPLNTLTPEQITSAMQAFRTGARQATIMNRIAQGYSAEEDERVAHYLSGLK
jgi:sulfide dehydrogenase cytochrome subunit